MKKLKVKTVRESHDLIKVHSNQTGPSRPKKNIKTKLYETYQRNHVILPGREKALEAFLKKDYKNLKSHKWNNGFSPNSEDALTWSCFDIISQLPFAKKIIALDEILEDAYDFECDFKFKDKGYSAGDINIFVGREYTGLPKEDTEVDASIETKDKLIFFEAKLYSSISLADKEKDKPHDQIMRKIRVGLECAKRNGQDFYFIFLDIAPFVKLLEFSNEKKGKENAKKNTKGKWKSAWYFKYYKKGWKGSLTPLRKELDGIEIDNNSLRNVSKNMGWLTWSSLFKTVMRGTI